MATVLLGNTSPVQAPVGTSVAVNGEQVAAPAPVESTLDEKTIVLVETPDFDSDGQAVPLDKKLAEVRHAFAVHSADQADWVEGHDEFFTLAVSQVFDCAVGRPDGWDAPAAPAAPSAPAAAPTASVVADVQVSPQEA